MKRANEPFAPWTFATVVAAVVAALLFFVTPFSVNWVTVGIVAATWLYIWSYADTTSGRSGAGRDSRGTTSTVTTTTEESEQDGR